MVPPVIDTVALPSEAPQDASIVEVELVNPVPELTVAESARVHPFASATITVCVVAQSPVAAALVCGPEVAAGHQDWQSVRVKCSM